MSANTSAVHIEFWVRETAPTRRIENRIEARLERLEETDAIDSYDVRTWGKTAATSRDTEAVEQRARYLARHAGHADLTEPRRVCEGRNGREYVDRKLPRLALVEFADDEVRSVVTPADGDAALSQRLAELAGTPRTTSDGVVAAD